MLEKFLDQIEYDSYEDFRKNYRVKVPENFNFAFDVADEWARIEPDRKAMVWCNESGEHRDFTFAEIKHYSDKAANFFLKNGIKKGDAVMLILQRRYEFWFCILGLHKIGAICIPATHLLKTKDIIYRNNAADIKMIVSVPEADVLNAVDEAQADSPSLQYKVVIGQEKFPGWISFDEEMEKASPEFLPPTGAEVSKNDDILLLYFTSGTTGMPKMVEHDYTYPLGHIMTAKYWQNVKDGGLHLTVAETGWAKAVWGKLYGQWISGASVFVYDYTHFVPHDLLNVISKYGVTSFCAPPTIYRYLINEDFSKFNLDKLEYCVVAGEPLNPEVYNRFLDQTGLKLREAYGQTELTACVVTFPYLEPKPGSMGKPTPGYDIFIADEDGTPCEVGEVGEIVINTKEGYPVGMFDGYYRDEELTRKVWHDGLYHTGDTAWYDEDGYFWFVGRTDDVIKSSGYRIGPFEVESALLEHPAVLECAVTGVPDEMRGAIVKATVVLTPKYEPSEDLKKQLQNFVKNITAPYKYPREIEFVTELPKTISGKIRRVEIRERDS